MQSFNTLYTFDILTPIQGCTVTPTYGAWGNWATADGKANCPEDCDSGSRKRRRVCESDCDDLSCVEVEQERVCPGIHCYKEASEYMIICV